MIEGKFKLDENYTIKDGFEIAYDSNILAYRLYYKNREIRVGTKLKFIKKIGGQLTYSGYDTLKNKILEVEKVFVSNSRIKIIFINEKQGIYAVGELSYSYELEILDDDYVNANKATLELRERIKR